MKIKLLDGSGTIDLKYLSDEPDRFGNERLYFRKGGKRLRLNAEPGSDAFMVEYRAALNGELRREKPGPVKDTSFRWLVERYFESSDFKRMSESARARRRRLLDEICLEPAAPDDPALIGAMPFENVPRSKIIALRDRKAELPEAANDRLKALRRVFAFAVEAEHIENNPARDVRYFPPNPDGFHTWILEEVIQYVERHPIGTKAHLALSLLLFTGQRKSDIVRFGRQMVRDGWLSFTQKKNRERKPVTLQLPILPELQASIIACPSNNLAFLVTSFGHPFTANGFGNWFRKRCDEAGLPQCSAHGLRKAGACIAVEGGASPHQLNAVFGWQTLKQAEHYTRQASQKRLAASAMHLLVPEQMRLKLSHQSLGIAESATNTG